MRCLPVHMDSANVVSIENIKLKYCISIKAKMASLSHEACEELTEFFQMLDRLSHHIQQSLFIRDPIELEHCKSKLERSIPIVAAILLDVSNNSAPNFVDVQDQMPPLCSLLEMLLSGMEGEMDIMKAQIGKASQISLGCQSELFTEEKSFTELKQVLPTSQTMNWMIKLEIFLDLLHTEGNPMSEEV